MAKSKNKRSIAAKARNLRLEDYAYKRKRRQYNKKIERDFKSDGAHKRYNATVDELRNKIEQIQARSVSICKVFSLIENCEETLEVLQDIYAKISDNDTRAVRIDFHHVEKITIDALLYMLAQFERLDIKPNCKVFGNRPKNIEAKFILEQSGFLKIVNNKFDTIKKSNDFVTIRSSNIVDGEIVADFTKFISGKLGQTIVEMQELQAIMMEVVANSDEHAYNDSSHLNRPTWFGFTRYDPKDTSVILSILDIGLGIPKTVKKRLHESLGFGGDDVALVKSAFDPSSNSVLRTQTKKKNRGKGLPDIGTFSKDSMVKNMVIVSGKAYIDLVNPERECLLKEALDGTLYSWRIKHAD